MTGSAGTAGTVRAWLFDAYPGAEGMVLWFVDEDGHPHRVTTDYRPAFYAAGPRQGLDRLRSVLDRQRIQADLTATTRQELFSGADLPVLRVAVRRPLQFGAAVARAARIPGLTLFTCDVSVPQLFFFETGLFPLGHYEIAVSNGAGGSGTIRNAEGVRSGRLAGWEPLAADTDFEYRAPPLLVMRLRLDGDPINPNHGWRSLLEVSVDGEHVVLSGERPEDLVQSLARLLQRYDPDVLLTEWGDSFLLPRLLRLSQSVSRPLPLNRDPGAGIRTRRSRSYVTYGQTVYQAGARFLHGRWHLDLRNSFIYTESEMAGLFELARLSRLPVQHLARTSTGTAISSMQLHRAVRDGILVPWHKSEPEGFKTAAQLLLTDKGGLTYQPLVGLFEGVGELDFSSMYPTMMARFNISPETVNCACCSDAEPVPEIGHTICHRRHGLVPAVLDHLLERRAYYKQRRQETDGAERAVYDQRQTALKWCLVTCLEGKTKVLCRHQNRWRIAPISDIVDAYLPRDRHGEAPTEDLFVPGIDENLKTVMKEVRSVIKSPAPLTMIRMRLRWGREAVMTPNHRCYVLRDGHLTVKRADELTVGDWIPLALTLDGVMPEGTDRIDLIRELKGRLSREEQKRWRVFGPTVQEFVRRNWRAIFREAIREYCVKTIWNWREYGYMPLSYLEASQFTDGERRTLRIGRGKLAGGIIQKLPALVAVDEDLGFLLGFFIGDGSYTRKMIRFDVGANEYDHLIRLRCILNRKFGVSTRIYQERKARMYVLQVNSVALIQIFREAFGLAGSADRGKLCVPGIILNGPTQAKRGFLLGLIGSDGHMGRSANYVRISSADSDFVRDLGLLLMVLGIDHRFVHHGHLYAIETKNLQETGKILTNGDLLSAKHRRAFRYRQSVMRYGRLSQIPVEASGLLELCKRARVIRLPRVSGIEMVSRTLASLKLEQLEGSEARSREGFAKKLNRFRQLTNSSLLFSPVVSLERVASAGQFVYCFRVTHAPEAFFIEGGILSGNSFGYLGYKNARYGRIEAHESTTAYSREVLLRAKEMAEDRGYRMLHALVDSMWLHKPGAGQTEYERLALDIEALTNLPIFVEGVYRWVAFLPSRLHKGVGVPNRYMGVFEDGNTKVRGIEVRRSDVPGLVEETQAEMLRVLFGAGNLDELHARVPDALAILEEAMMRLQDREVTPGDLALTVTLSQEPHEYRSNNVVALTARMMARSGIRLHPGEAVQYVVTDADAKIPDERVRPLALLGTDWSYDADRYAELLCRAGETVLELLGYTRERLRRELWEPLRRGAGR